MTNLQKGIKYCAIAFGVFLIVSILSAILGAIGIIDMITTGGSTTGESFTKTYQDIRSIDIDVAYSDILITQGEEFKVDATNISRRFSATVKNDTLKIKEKRNWFWMGSRSGKIVVTVPETAVLQDVSIDSGAGRIELNKILASNLDVSQGAGLLTIRDGDFSSTSIDGGAGKIEVSSSILNRLELDAGVGQVDMEAMITGNSEIDSGVGEIRLRLLGEKEDYRIHADKGVGSLRIDGKNYSDNTSFGSGSNFIDIDGGVGSITVDFISSVTE